jgi:hypothetical protein
MTLADNVISLLATERTPPYRPLPTEPATVIVLPVIRIEPEPEPTPKPTRRRPF